MPQDSRSEIAHILCWAIANERNLTLTNGLLRGMVYANATRACEARGETRSGSERYKRDVNLFLKQLEKLGVLRRFEGERGSWLLVQNIDGRIEETANRLLRATRPERKVPNKKAKSTFRAKAHEMGSSATGEVILASSDSRSMASSWTDQLVLLRQADGTLVLKLERVGMDAIPEEEWDAEGWAELHYESDVEGPSWLCDFLEEPPSKLADRVALPDADEVLRRVAALDPNLAEDAARLLKERRDL